MKTQAELQASILDWLYESLPRPPFTEEETAGLAHRVYDFVWQRLPGATRDRAASPDPRLLAVHPHEREPGVHRTLCHVQRRHPCAVCVLPDPGTAEAGCRVCVSWGGQLERRHAVTTVTLAEAQANLPPLLQQ